MSEVLDAVNAELSRSTRDHLERVRQSARHVRRQARRVGDVALLVLLVGGGLLALACWWCLITAWMVVSGR